MSTTLLRHSITETLEIAQAIDAGQALRPDLTRAEIMRQLIVLGAETARRNLAARHNVIVAWAGFLPGVYAPDAAVQLKEEWPA